MTLARIIRSLQKGEQVGHFIRQLSSEARWTATVSMLTRLNALYTVPGYITSRCMHSPRLIITIDRLEERPYMWRMCSVTAMSGAECRQRRACHRFNNRTGRDTIQTRSWREASFSSSTTTDADLIHDQSRVNTSCSLQTTAVNWITSTSWRFMAGTFHFLPRFLFAKFCEYCCRENTGLTESGKFFDWVSGWISLLDRYGLI